MDFAQFTQKAKALGGQLGEKVKEVTNKAIEKGAETLKNSPFVIQNPAQFEELISLSTNKTSPSGRIYEKKSLLIIGDPKTDFFKKALYELPVIYAKAWSQNTAVKLMSIDTPGIDFAKYAIVVGNIPSCIVFGDKKVIKIIAGEKNINTLVTSLSLDILGTVDTL